MQADLPAFPHPCLYAGDFNCHHVDWGYDNSNPDGECLAGWASANNFTLLYSPKKATSFHSGRWKTDTNPDLAFASVDLDSRLPDRCIFGKLPRSQHRPSLISPPKLAHPKPSKPAKRWNFRKTNWNHYSNLTSKQAKSLPPPESENIDQAYQCFCKVISTAAKKCIFCGRRSNHIPSWDAECEDLYQHFLQSPEGPDSDRAATALLTRLDEKRRNHFIDFSHSSRLAWNTINSLTGRSRQSPCQCPVSADAIASQLVKNGKYEGVNRRSSRLVLQEASDLWRADPLHPANVSGSFSHREFTAALQHLKPEKATGPDSICPLIHAGAGLKSWLRGFLSSCLHHLKIPKIWRRALVVAVPKPPKLVEDPRSYCTISLLCVPHKIL